MKKLLVIIFGLIIFGLGNSSYAWVPSDSDISVSENVYYNLVSNKWSKVIEESEGQEDNLVLTKKYFKTSSVYLNNKKKPIAKLHSDYEFVWEDKLIGVDNANLKYYIIEYNNGILIENPLPQEMLSQIFPNSTIVKISEFKDGEYVYNKGFFEVAKIVLLNDTDKVFFKYSYKPAKVQTTEVKGYIVSQKPEKIIYSHYGDSEGSLNITIKNCKK